MHLYPHPVLATLSSAVAACLCEQVSEQVASRLVANISACKENLQPAAFLSLLATLLSGQSKLTARMCTPQRQLAMIAACCQALRTVGDSGATVHLPSAQQQ